MTLRTSKVQPAHPLSVFISITFSLALLFLISCAKRSDVPAPATESSSSTTAPASAPTQAASAPADDGTATALAAELTQVVRKYAAEKQRAPKSFEEIVSAGYLPSVPAAPAGKKFVIDNKLQVTLTDH